MKKEKDMQAVTVKEYILKPSLPRQMALGAKTKKEATQYQTYSSLLKRYGLVLRVESRDLESCTRSLSELQQNCVDGRNAADVAVDPQMRSMIQM